MDAIFDQIRALAKDADEASRKKLLDGLNDLYYSIESPNDSLNRIISSTSRLAVARIGVDLKLFNILAESPKALTVEELSQKTGAAPLLLSRVLRYLASIGDVKEVDQDVFTANNITHVLAIEGFQAGVHHNFDTVGPALQALPDFLKENQYQDVVDPAHTPFQKAWDTKLPAFLWAQSRPDLLHYFNQYMTVQRQGMPTWLDFYPYREKSQGLDPDRPFFVDVGGGLGHQSIALRNKLPEFKNRIIVQDMGAVTEHANKDLNVEFMEHDFWQPQPIKEAKIYYMRNVLHDYPEEKAILILKSLLAACAPDSVILIDEMVVPNKGAHWQSTQNDFIMMTALAALERTHDQWYDLTAKAGLRIQKMYTYTMSLQDSIIECVAA